MSGNKPITIRETQDAVFSLNPNKAPGADNLDVRIIRQVFQSSPHLLSDWANKCASLGHFPDILKTGQVVFFHKNGKDPSQPKSYRPICLIPTLSKLLEKIMTRRLIFHLETNQQLSNQQYGFRENRSCETALNSLFEIIHKNRESKVLTSAVAIDITGAFDTVNWNAAINELIRCKCPSQLTNLIASYLENRRVTVAWGGEEISHTLARGCPQGSCIGPLLWLVTAEQIIKKFSSPKTDLIVFADDFLLVTTGNHRREIERYGQAALYNISALIQANGLTISASKTNAITFTLAGKLLKREPSFKLEGKRVPNVKTLKYLGLNIHRNLSWHDHLNALQ